MFVLIPGAANECWPGVSLTVGAPVETQRKEGDEGGQYMDMEEEGLQEQPQGLKFPTPGVVLLLDYV